MWINVENVTRVPNDIGESSKWVKFQFWGDNPFKCEGESWKNKTCGMIVILLVFFFCCPCTLFVNQLMIDDLINSTQNDFCLFHCVCAVLTSQVVEHQHWLKLYSSFIGIISCICTSSLAFPYATGCFFCFAMKSIFSATQWCAPPPSV